MDYQALQEDWLATLADAALSPEDVRLYPHHDPPNGDRPTALYFAPGKLIMGRDAAQLTAARAQDARDNYERHQIVLHTDAPREVLAAKLRHELQHMRQWLEAPDGDELFLLYQAVLAGLDEFVGLDRRGSGMLYNVVPLESDANAAAARFMQSRLTDEEIEAWVASESGVLFRLDEVGPTSLTPARRLVCAAALSPGRTKEWLAPHPDGLEAIAARVAQNEALWPRLLADDGLRARVAAARLVVPTTDQLAAVSPDYRQAWAELRMQLLAALDAAYRIAASADAGGDLGPP